jgi:hypothetical protein
MRVKVSSSHPDRLVSFGAQTRAEPILCSYSVWANSSPTILPSDSSEPRLRTAHIPLIPSLRATITRGAPTHAGEPAFYLLCAVMLGAGHDRGRTDERRCCPWSGACTDGRRILQAGDGLSSVSQAESKSCIIYYPAVQLAPSVYFLRYRDMRYGPESHSSSSSSSGRRRRRWLARGGGCIVFNPLQELDLYLSSMFCSLHSLFT